MNRIRRTVAAALNNAARRIYDGPDIDYTEPRPYPVKPSTADVVLVERDRRG